MTQSPDTSSDRIAEIYDCLACDGEQKVYNLKSEEYEPCRCMEKIAALKAHIATVELEARIDTANYLHRNQGTDLPKRSFDTDTDEYICTEYIPRLEEQLEDQKGKEAR